MKKLILSVAIVLGSLSSFAVTPVVSSENNIVITEEGFKEITADKLPAAVVTALKTSHPDAVLDKAFVNEQNEYKLEVTVGETKGVVYADAEGNWIQK